MNASLINWNEKDRLRRLIMMERPRTASITRQKILFIAYFCSPMVEKPEKISIRNRKASCELLLTENFTAGLVLTGTEIKSIRNNDASIAEAFCMVLNDEIWVRNMHIAEYDKGSYNNHVAKRDRKLLLNAKEIKKIKNKMKDKGIALIPIHLFINEKGHAKLEIAIAKGKKLYDKRDSLKSKDKEREIARGKKGL
jgi:SsrA-binding protein